MAGPIRSTKPARRALSRLLRDVRGATAVEYGLIVALIVIAVIASIAEVANVTTTMWNHVSSEVTKVR